MTWQDKLHPVSTEDIMLSGYDKGKLWVSYAETMEAVKVLKDKIRDLESGK